MSFRGLQATLGMGTPKLAEQAGPVGTGVGSEPVGNERTEWKEEQERQKKQNMGYKSGGKVTSASRRADGAAQRGKTRGKII